MAVLRSDSQKTLEICLQTVATKLRICWLFIKESDKAQINEPTAG